MQFLSPGRGVAGGTQTSPGLWKTLFPVAFHVTYWDDLGWIDSFAQPAFTQRQRDYASRFGQDSVYTPEFIVNGREWRGWFSGERQPPPTSSTRGRLSLVLGKSKVAARYLADAVDKGGAFVLNVAWLAQARSSDVAAGENSGRHLEHDFLVLNFQSQPMTSEPGRWTANTLAPGPVQSQADAVVAWVSTLNQPIVQVTGGPLR